jgi:hypothetical protein
VKQALAIISLFAASLVARAAGAVPVVEDKEKGIAVNVGVLVQPTFQMTMPGTQGGERGPCGTERRCSAGIGSPRGTGNYDLFLRRARIMVWGSATKEISFFLDTDEPNIGKNGDYTPRTFVQDAFATYSFNPMARIDMGLMLVPFSHHTLEGATSLNALDYHSDLIRFPAGRTFRDVGVQFRGVAGGDHLHYRLGIFEGVRNAAVPALPATVMGVSKPTLNPGGVPRFTATLRANILGVEPDFFLKGIYFSATPIISVGGGFDYQPNSMITVDVNQGRLEYKNYTAGSADVFVEYPFTADDELIFKATYYNWGTGTTNTAALAGNVSGAYSWFAEAGFRHAWIEPIAFVDYLYAKKKLAPNAPTALAIHGGANFWIMKHNFNIKTDFGWKHIDRNEESTLKDIVWTTQAQLFF